MVRRYYSYVLLVLLLLISAWIWADTGAKHRARQARPIRLGTSGGNNADITTEFCCSGTLGALVKDFSGTRYVLSNNHVIANNNSGRPGQNIGQPGLIDVNCRVTRAEPVAALSRFVRIFFDRPNRVDAAIARVLPGKVNAKGRIMDIGRPGSPIEARLGMLVKKSGRTSGKTVGRIIAIRTSIRVEIPQFCGDEKGKVARFVDQFIVDSTNSRSFTESGDSGSLIVTSRATCPRTVGLLFAGDDQGMAIGNRIQNVLSALNVSLVGCATASSTSVETKATHLDPEIQKLEIVRQRNEERLFRNPEVVGVGIGANEHAISSYTVVVFAKSSTRLRTVPSHVEGYPIQVIITSGFKAK